MTDHPGVARALRPHRVVRRTLLRAAGLGAAAISLAGLAGRGLAAPPAVTTTTGSRPKVRFIWSQTALCTVAVPIAVDRDIFEKHRLDVELVRLGGSTVGMICAGSNHWSGGST